ncbi:MAG: RDD family protein [Verrucomicrobiaceae bacterium]|nr:RDD family protein [Verrucomicrobiaceae bacterium]
MKYHLAREDEKIGEFSDLDISAGLREGRFRPTDLCWAPGMTDWEPLEARFHQPAPEEAPLSALEQSRPPPQDDDSGSLPLASRWLRLLAWMLDWMTILPATMLLSKALELEAFMAKHRDLGTDAFIEAYYAHIQATVEAHPERFHLPIGLLTGLVVLNVVLLTVRGQTIGKWLAGVRIVRFQTGLRAGFVAVVLLRHVVMLVLTSIQYIGIGLLVFDLGCIFRRDRRCLHDLIADTMVVSTRTQMQRSAVESGGA